MTLKLSHTQIETYKQCGQKYKLHYIDKLREDKLHSPLFFGSALDKAIETLLKQKTGESTDDELEVFVSKLTFTPFHNNLHFLPTSTKVTYLKSDFDIRLLSYEDFKELFTTYNLSKENIPGFYEEVYNLLRKEQQVLESDLVAYNYLNWCSLKEKGLLLVKAYKEQIIPKIKSIKAIQKYVDLKNEDGDSLIGYIDFIAEWEDGKTIIFDNKTSSRKYGPNSAKESQQLTIYGENEQNFEVGFIVLVKELKWIKNKVCDKCKIESSGKHKNCITKGCDGNWIVTESPEVQTQVLIDTLDKQSQEVIFSEIQEITHSIKDGVFHKNWDNCYMYNKKCPYYEYCRSGNKANLIEKKEE